MLITLFSIPIRSGIPSYSCSWMVRFLLEMVFLPTN